MASPLLERSEDYNKYTDFLIDQPAAVLQSYLDSNSNSWQQYRKCRITLCGYNDAICEPLDSNSVTHIFIEGRINCGMCFTGDIVVVKTVDNFSKVIGVLKPAFTERKPTFLCRIDVNSNNRNNNQRQQRYDRVRPICGSLPAISLRRPLKVPLERQDFVVIKVRFLKWKSNSLVPLGEEVHNSIQPIHTFIQTLIGNRALDGIDSSREFPELKQLQQTLARKIEKRQKVNNYIFTNAITIDTDECKVFDSAFSVSPERLKDVEVTSGIRVFVHVADVSAIVKKNDRLDVEASERLMSYSGINRRQLLPGALQKMCSLDSNEKGGVQLENEVNKLTLTFCFTVSPNGIYNFEIFKSAIKVRRNYFYKEVQQMFIDAQTNVRQVPDSISVLHQAVKWLIKQRLPKAYLFRDGKVKYPDPELIVSEITIAMNRLSAEYLLNCSNLIQTVPLRTQTIPDLKDVRSWLKKNPTLLYEYLYFRTYLLCGDGSVHEDIVTMCLNTGLKEISEFILRRSTVRVNAAFVRQLRKENFSARFGKEIIEDEKNLPILRAGRYDWFHIMKPAKYSVHDCTEYDNDIHFQLHLLSYVQVSAPIRRYLDIVVHRLIKHAMKQTNEELDGKDSNGQNNRNANDVNEASKFAKDIMLVRTPYEKQEIVNMCDRININKEKIKNDKRLGKWAEELQSSYKGWTECVILSVSQSGFVVFTNSANPSGTKIEYKNLNLYNNPKLKQRRKERSLDYVSSTGQPMRKSNKVKSTLEGLDEHYKAVISWQGRIYDTRKTNAPNARPVVFSNDGLIDKNNDKGNDTENDKKNKFADNNDDDGGDADAYNSDNEYETASESSYGFAEDYETENTIKGMKVHEDSKTIEDSKRLKIPKRQELASTWKNSTSNYDQDDDSGQTDEPQIAETISHAENSDISGNDACSNLLNAGTGIRDTFENSVEIYSIDPRSRIFKVNIADWKTLQEAVIHEEPEKVIEEHLRKVFEDCADSTDYSSISDPKKILVNSVTSEMKKDYNWTSHQVSFNIDVEPSTVLRAQLGDPITFKYSLFQQEHLKLRQTVPKANSIEDPIELISFTNEESFENDVNFCLLHKKYPLLHFGDSSDIWANLNKANNVADYYKRHWLPILGLESAVESASATSIIISRRTTVRIPLNLKKDKTVSVILEKEFCAKRHLVKIYDDKTYCDSFICLRGVFCRCEGNICTCVNKRVWIGHGRVMSCSFIENGSKVNLDVKLIMYNYEENCRGILFSKFTVEFLPYSLPAKRKEYAVRSVTSDGNRLYENIALTRAIAPGATQNDGSLQELERLLRIYKDSDLPGSSHITLNPTQTQAIREAHRKPFSLIQGPPGTGKTVTGAFLVHSFAALNSKNHSGAGSKKQILYCGPSNAAVDVATEKFLKLQERSDETKFNVVRVYGSALEQQIYPEPQENLDSFDPKQKGYQVSVGTRCSSRALHNLIREEENPYSKEIKEFDKKFQENITNPGNSCERDIQAYRDLKAKAEKVELEKCDVIYATTICSASFRIRKWTKMEQIIIDESGMCTEAESLVPLSSHSDVTRVVLIGDHKQLRPIILCHEARRLGLDISLFERYAEYTTRDITMLVTQYRMHSSICRFPSKEFYDGLLNTEYNPVFDYLDTNLRFVSKLGLRWPSNRRVVFVDVFGQEEALALATNDGNVLSKKNYNESKEVVRVYKLIFEKLKKYYKESKQPAHSNEITKTLEQTAADSIAVISPYQLQCSTIRRSLQKEYSRTNSANSNKKGEAKDNPKNFSDHAKSTISDKKSSLQFNVRTVVSSQGAEWDYVILSTVRSIPGSELRDQSNGEKRSLNLGCIGNPNQINVALTRARHGLIIIGNKETLKRNEIWERFLNDCESDDQKCLQKGGKLFAK